MLLTLKTPQNPLKKEFRERKSLEREREGGRMRRG
jgi:hypothetical protein